MTRIMDARILRNDPDAYMAQYGKRDKNPVMANAPEVGKPDDAWKDTVPEHYHKHGIVFSKEDLNLLIIFLIINSL